MAKIGARSNGLLTVFLIIFNINIVFASSLDQGNNNATSRIDLQNEYESVESTSIIPVVAVQSSEKNVTTLATEYSNKASLGVNGTNAVGEIDSKKNLNQFPKKFAASTMLTKTGMIASETELTTPVTVNPSDGTVQKKESIADERALNKDDMPENVKLSALKKNNLIKNQIEDHHQYYNSTIVVDKEKAEIYWNDIRNMSPNWILSQSHRRAKTIALSFDFPFYGYPVRNVIVTTSGFIYTGDYVHSWLAATQYIAPLMANFDTSLSNDSFVRLNDTGSSFTVLWENVYLQDEQNLGKFTFSATLHKNGDIIFTYFSVPNLCYSIQDNIDLKVGLSDAYIIDKVIYFALRKTIYEYHRVNFANADITNSTIITLKALPTCLEYTDCASCVNHVTVFNCSWCPSLNRCSTGTDRKKQEWLSRDCDRNFVTEENFCPAIASETISETEAVVASKVTLTTSATGNPSDDTEQKVKETSVAANPSIETEKTDEETSVTANPSDDTMEKKKEKILETDNVSENESQNALKTNILAVNQTENHHQYYNSTIVVDKEKAETYWNEIRKMSPNWILSHADRRTMTVVLSFDFPFYGHPVRNVTVATGGFIYTGDYVHSWLAATQYIAPLMANFDTSLSIDSFVRLNDTGSSFTVLWENVYLQDKLDLGKFTFSATLHKNGDIVFTYFSVPILVNAIQNDKHPVKVGLSDAYIIDKVVYFARRKTMNEYHRVNFANADITNSTIITLKALPTCLEYTDCASCVNHVTVFNCSWCPSLKRCSTGTDRKKQEWLSRDCDRNFVTEENFCPSIASETISEAQGVLASEVKLTTSVTGHPSGDTVQKESTEEKVLDTNDVPENKTLNALKKNNLIASQTKNHDHYYNITYVVDQEKVEAYWNENRNILPNWMLSQAHRELLTTTLSFEFPFYGHPVRTVGVSTGGFIFTGDFEHSLETPMRYIAPLMANFDTSLSKDSFVCFNDTGSSFTVIWENVQLHDNQDMGEFTFSTTLHKNGDIVFTYFSLPNLPNDIQNGKQFLKVGLSDAKLFPSDGTDKLYKYKSVNLTADKITNFTIITLKALSACPECADWDSSENNGTESNAPMVNKVSEGATI